MATNERSPRQAEIINYALDLFRAGLYVGRPVRVESVDNDKCTVDVTPMLKDSYTDDEDNVQTYDLPVIPALPILFMEGNNFVDTFPIKKGDAGWILFADRSLDQWQQIGNASGPVDPKTEFRHSLPAKGLFLPGGRSVKEAFDEWDPDRRVIGAHGGPRIALTSDKIHLGVAHKEDATDAVALASLVKTEINKVIDSLKDFITNTYNSHTHQVTTAGSPFSHTGTAAPPLSPGSPPSPASDVKSEKVLCK